MIAGLPLEYACTRSTARLAQRPGEPTWHQWHAARALPVLVDAVRGSSAAPWISGIGLAAPHADIEPAFRTQLRARIAEVACWAPEEWRPALWWTQRLIDLPFSAHLAAGGKAPGWAGGDPGAADRQFDGRPAPSTPAPRPPMLETPMDAVASRLRPMTQAPTPARPVSAWQGLAATAARSCAPRNPAFAPRFAGEGVTPSPACGGALGWGRDCPNSVRILGSGEQRSGQGRAQQQDGREAHLHPALLAWLDEWRALWPPRGDEDRAALEHLVGAVARHLRRFAAAAPEDATALRAELQARLLTLLRRHPARPVALFAALALHALDLERLRAEFVLRALFADGDAR